MTVQELIDQLLKIEDKEKLVVNYYDGSYNLQRSLATIDLYTSDDCTNVYDSLEEAIRMADEGEDVFLKHCIVIDNFHDIYSLFKYSHTYFYSK